jgi:hypothetical protein
LRRGILPDMGRLLPRFLAEFEPAEVAAVSWATVLFLILTIGLVILFIGILLLTRSRRRMHSRTVPADEPQPPDPWKESANRVQIDERDSQDRGP